MTKSQRLKEVIQIIKDNENYSSSNYERFANAIDLYYQEKVKEIKWPEKSNNAQVSEYWSDYNDASDYCQKIINEIFVGE